MIRVRAKDPEKAELAKSLEYGINRWFVDKMAVSWAECLSRLPPEGYEWLRPLDAIEGQERRM